MNDFLFVCQENRLRSPTCEHVARCLGFAADSAGTSETAVRPLTMEAMERAANIICMTPFQVAAAKALWAGASTSHAPLIETWNIPDEYDYCDPQLIHLVRTRIAEYKRPPR